MKRFIKALVMTGLFLTVFSSLAYSKAPLSTNNYAVQQEQKKFVVVNGVNVRLRFEPNTNASWLCYDNGKPRYAPKGTKLTYLGEKGDFYYVQYAGYKLYISKQYSKLTTESNTAPAAKESKKFFVVVNGTNVRLRTGPGTNYKYFTWDDGSPCYLPKGTYLDYLGEANDFYKCSYKGKTVYISKKYSYVTK